MNRKKKKYKTPRNIVPSSIPKGGNRLATRKMYMEAVADKMAHRYYFLSTICRLRYDDCMIQLALEFDVSTRTVEEKLKRRVSLVEDLLQNQTTASDLRKKYPWIDWSHRPTPATQLHLL